ncbi:sensor histidine kinase [Desertivirga brevis]|uniref:sensor histidine kinase n=1 Tax=Desertivirga brevis TaxID=2810310 RepID=UPI001A96B1B0|nr:HAMP domain-containing sensor histidine kinase [Pedobacter sp. SYSU D00873]
MMLKLEFLFFSFLLFVFEAPSFQEEADRLNVNSYTLQNTPAASFISQLSAERSFWNKPRGLEGKPDNFAASISTVYTDPDPFFDPLDLETNSAAVYPSEAPIPVISDSSQYFKTVCSLSLVSILLLGSLLWWRWRVAIQKLETQFISEQERLKVLQKMEQERRDAEWQRKLNNEKLEFLKDLSQELRIQVSLILSPVDQLLLRETNGSKSVHLRMIRRNVACLLDVVNQSSDKKNIGNKELKLNPAEGDFVALVRNLVDYYREGAARKQINLQFRSSFKCYFGAFDYEKVEWAVSNIISSTLKGKRNEGTVKIEIERDCARTGLILRITDTRMDKEEEVGGLDSFPRSDINSAFLNSRNRWGLSVAREFIGMHGGTIDLESIAGVNTKYSVYLPLERIDRLQTILL